MTSKGLHPTWTDGAMDHAGTGTTFTHTLEPDEQPSAVVTVLVTSKVPGTSNTTSVAPDEGEVSSPLPQSQTWVEPMLSGPSHATSDPTQASWGPKMEASGTGSMVTSTGMLPVQPVIGSLNAYERLKATSSLSGDEGGCHHPAAASRTPSPSHAPVVVPLNVGGASNTGDSLAQKDQVWPESASGNGMTVRVKNEVTAQVSSPAAAWMTWGPAGKFWGSTPPPERAAAASDDVAEKLTVQSDGSQAMGVQP